MRIKADMEIKINDQIEAAVEIRIQEIYMKIGRVLHEALSVKLHEEGPKQRKMVIISMIRNNLSPEVGNKVLIEWNEIEKNEPSVVQNSNNNESVMEGEGIIGGDINNTAVCGEGARTKKRVSSNVIKTKQSSDREDSTLTVETDHTKVDLSHGRITGNKNKLLGNRKTLHKGKKYVYR